MNEDKTYRVWPFARWRVVFTLIILPILLVLAVVLFQESIARVVTHLVPVLAMLLLVITKYAAGGDHLILSSSAITLGKQSLDPARIHRIEVNGPVLRFSFQNGKKKTVRLFKSSAGQVQQLIGDLQYYVWRYGVEVAEVDAK